MELKNPVKQTLMEKLLSLNTATPETALSLKNLFVPVSFKKGTLFDCEQQTLPILYFIETGLVRSYFFYHHEDYTAWLMDGGFILPSAGFFTKLPAIEYVQFLTDATGHSLNLFKAEALAQKEPRMYRMLLEIYETNTHQCKHRELMLRLKDAEDRFLFSRKFDKNLAGKFINRIAASFLNIKEKYYSRIKNKYKH